MYLDTILDCVRAIAATLTPETTPYVTETLAWAAMEAGLSCGGCWSRVSECGCGWPGSG
jgi:hypothetical protein